MAAKNFTLQEKIAAKISHISYMILSKLICEWTLYPLSRFFKSLYLQRICFYTQYTFLIDFTQALPYIVGLGKAKKSYSDKLHNRIFKS